MGFEDGVEQSFSRPRRQNGRQVQADIRTHLIRRPARDIIPRSVELEFPPIGFDPSLLSCRCDRAAHVTDFFRLPGDQVVEIGRQIAI
jgi:hypothetical protein